MPPGVISETNLVHTNLCLKVFLWGAQSKTPGSLVARRLQRALGLCPAGT